MKKKKFPEEVKKVQEHKIKQNYSNKHISYSQLSNYMTCPHSWYLSYVKKLAPYQPSIYTVFGKAIHSTIQEWLSILYSSTIKEANEVNLGELLITNLKKAYKSEKFQNAHKHFSSLKELSEFYEDGLKILEFIKKHRGKYFSSKNNYLAGIEVLLYQEIRPGVFFKGYIDLVFYDKDLDKWKLVDIKTSVRGWDKKKKTDERTVAQLILYKEFFSKQFGIDIDKIEVEYFIVKRKIYEEAEFAAAKKRVQEYLVSSGKIKRGKSLKFMNEFIANTLDADGNFIEKSYPVTSNLYDCTYCAFKGHPLCPKT